MSNPIFSWTDLADSAGRKVKDYKISFDNGFLDVMGKIYTPITTVLWDFFMFLAVGAATMVGWIGNPKWLNGLDGAYKSATENFFSAVNPLVLAVGGFGILMFYIAVDKAKSTSTKFSKEDINRVVAAVALMGFISVMMLNPFALLKAALSVVQIIVAAITGDDSATMSAFSVDAMIRQPTLIINYNGAVSADCAETWSKTGKLTDSSGCYTTDSSSAETILLGGLAVVMAALAFAFAAWALWKYVRHLSVAVFGFVSLSWVAALSLFRRRQFDQLATVFAISCGNLVMVFVIQVISIGGPALVSEVMQDWGQSGYAVLQMIFLAITYLVLLGLLVAVTNKHSALVTALKADANNSLRIMGSPGSSKYTSLQGKTLRESWSALRDKAESTHTRYKMLKGGAAGGFAFLKGKSAELDTGSSDGGGQMENLEDVQSTVSLSAGPSQPRSVAADTVPVSIPSRFRRMVNASKEFRKAVVDGARNAADGLPAVPARVPVAGASAVAQGVVNDVADEIKDRGWSLDDVQIMGASHLEALTSQLSELQMSRDLLQQIERALTARNMILDEPEFGGRSAPDQVRSAMEDALNGFIKDMNSSETLTVGTYDSVPVVVGRVSHADRMAEFTRSRNSMEQLSIGAISAAYSSDGEQVQSTASLGSRSEATPISSKALVRYQPPGPRSFPNAMHGGPATRGDVGLTKLTTLCDRGSSDAMMEEARLKATVMGEVVIPVIPLEDVSQSVRFSPDRPGSPVSPASGVGFGDSIY